MKLNDLITHLGKGPGFFGFAFIAASLGALIAYVKPEAVLGYAAVLAPICTGLYGGGAMKAWAESKNGSNGSSSSSSPSSPSA